MSSLSTLPKLEAMDDLSALDDFNFQVKDFLRSIFNFQQ